LGAYSLHREAFRSSIHNALTFPVKRPNRAARP
jgi:hypothetical protein